MIKNSILVAYNDSASDLLIDAVKRLFPEDRKDIRILDMGTGNGYIAISLYLSGYTNIVASDANLFAVRLCKKNKFYNKISFPVYKSDLFESLEGFFDVVIFNFSLLGGILTYFLYPIKNLIFGKECYLDRIKNKRRIVLRFIKRFCFKDHCKSIRIVMIKRFINQLPRFTKRNSIALLHIHSNEVREFSRIAKVKVLEHVGESGLIIAMSDIKRG